MDEDDLPLSCPRDLHFFGPTPSGKTGFGGPVCFVTLGILCGFWVRSAGRTSTRVPPSARVFLMGSSTTMDFDLLSALGLLSGELAEIGG